MLELMQDKEAIRFTDGSNINLNLLKNEIDRRLLKITSMINNFEQPSSQTRYQKIGCCQTQSIAVQENKSILVDDSQSYEKALQSLNSNLLLLHDQRNGKDKQKPKESSFLIMLESNILIDNQQKECSDLEKEKQENTSVALSDELNLDLSNIKFDDNVSYEEQANELKQYIRQSLSNRKKKQSTDRSKMEGLRIKTQRHHTKKVKNDQPELKFKQIRYTVSFACIQKMQNQLKKLIGDKRVYQSDTKVRINLIKKVQEKFKNNDYVKC